MSGVYSGVQARIREKEPLATYVHCAAHNLNLVLNDAVKHIPEMEQFLWHHRKLVYVLWPQY